MSLLKTTTILSRSLDGILPALNSVLSIPHKTRVFTLSSIPSQPQDVLARLAGRLTDHPSSIGCLSAPLPTHPNHIACSVSLWGDGVTLFRSTIPGKEEVQVGRWHSFRKQEAGDESGKHELLNPVKWDDVWAQNTKPSDLPESLASLDSKSVHQILYFSDNAYEGLSNALTYHLPRTNKLGLLASSTVFTTGRPSTLFYNQSIHSSGAVGLAIQGSSSLGASKLEVRYHGLKTLTPPMVVTRTEGNLVLSLDETNPTAILLAAIKKNGLDRVMSATGLIENDEKFYLGVVDGVGASEDQVTETYPIISGDPARGPIALLSDRAPKEGSMVQFFHRTCNPVSDLARTHGQIGFVATTDEQVRESAPLDDVVVLEDKFLVASENGFIVESGCKGSWRCTVPDAVGSCGY